YTPPSTHPRPPAIELAGHRRSGDTAAGARPRPMPAGRGVFVSRKRGKPLVQTGLVDVEY
ncbi:hypothetical protein, partial [Streptomyces tricolor]